MTNLSKALKRTLLGAAMASAAILAPAQAAELDLSGKTVNFVIPFAETGGSASWANFYAPLLSEALPGKPTVVGYTAKDLTTWSNVMARALCCAGATKGDMVHNAYGYGLFTGGLGAHYGAEKIGASVIPMSGGNTKKQLMIMQDFGSTVLTCTPSYSLYLAEAAAEEGVDIRDFKLQIRRCECNRIIDTSWERQCGV